MLTKARVRIENEYSECTANAHSRSWQQLSALSPRITPAISHRGTKLGWVQQSTLPQVKEDILPKTIPTSASTRDAEIMQNMRYSSKFFKTPAWLTEIYWQHTVYALFTAAAGLFQQPGQSAQAYSSTLTLPLHKYSKCLQREMCCNAWSWKRDQYPPVDYLTHCPCALPCAHLPQTDGSNWLHASVWLVLFNLLIKLILLIKSY